MILKWIKNTIVYLFAFTRFIGSSSSRSTCDILVNNQNYLEEKLYSSKNYEIKFALPLKSKPSAPIGYSIDVECGLRNVTKLKSTFSYDIQNIPVEINYISCNEALVINKIKFSKELERSFLNFFTGFNLTRNISSEIKMQLNLNTR